MNELKAPLTLSGDTVDLVSLEESHFEILQRLAVDETIWKFYPFNLSDPSRFRETLVNALTERERGAHFPFVVYHRRDNRIIGSTRFMDIQPKHRKLEIGFTWLVPEYWGSGVNPECKLLLLTHCFESLGIKRVHIKTDENNLRSRKAIEKIGGTFEGIIRNDMVRDNGSERNSASYSIIDKEWQEVKAKLIKLVESRSK